MKKTTFLSVLLITMLTFTVMMNVSAQQPPQGCIYSTTPPLGNISFCELQYVNIQNLWIWTGNANPIDNNWLNPANWWNGFPPPFVDVWIPSNCPSYPTLVGPVPPINNIWIRDGASILGNGFLQIMGLAYVERLVDHLNNEAVHWHHCDWDDNSGPIPVPSDIHYLSSPITNATDSTVEQDAVFKWNELTEDWVWLHHMCSEPCWKPPAIWVPGIGYSVVPNDNWWCQTSECPIYTTPPGLCAAPWKCQHYREWVGNNMNHDFIEVPVTYTVNPGKIYPPGWNLMGNPYPSAILWPLVPTNNVFGPSACMWDDVGQAYINVMGQNNGFIPIVEGFMVQCMPGGGLVTFIEGARVHNNMAPLFKSERIDFLSIDVTNDVNPYRDKTFIHINPDAENGMDLLDGGKLGNGPQTPMIYSVLADNTSLAYNSLQSTETNPQLPIHFKAGVTGNYTLQISGIESFSETTPLFLEDLYGEITQDMRENPVYTFSANSTDDPARFVLHFTPLGVNDYHYGDINIYSYNRTVFVDLPAKMNGTANVFNMLGKEIISEPMIPGKLNKLNVPGPTGYYVVRVVSSGNVTTQKVFIN